MTREIDVFDKSRQPDMAEISSYVGNPLFDELGRHMSGEYQALCKVEYSGDKVLLGWNVKYRKAGKTLCTVYPRRGYFPMLLVVGAKEKERVEALLPTLCAEFQEIYRNTQEGIGQRWLLLEFRERSALYDDALKIIDIRRKRG